MCCLGFCATALGYSKDNIINISMPCYVEDKSKFPSNFFHGIKNIYNSDTIAEIIRINDSLLLNDKVREEQLTLKFKKLNIEVTFED